jgi:hypothetical protein
MLLLVTGLPSVGKNRLVDALANRLGPAHVVVGVLPGAHAGAVLHVHAESDVEALIEGSWRPRPPDHAPEVVVRVDWEALDKSVERVLETLDARLIALGA